MLLSVIIVSYNTKELLSTCLSSVFKALDKIDGEVFVVDNNSYDGTIKFVKEKFPQVQLIANKNNLGFSKANNLALKKAQGTYFLILNPDTKVLPDTFDKMLNFMEITQKVAVSTCRVELASGKLDKDCRRHFPTPWRSLCHFSGLEKIFNGSKLFDSYYFGYISEDCEVELDACVGAFMLIRASAAQKVGYLDEDFFFYGEDLDWCFRFKEAGYKIVYTPITKIIHFKGASSGIKNSTKHLTKATLKSKERVIRESTRAMKIFYQKHYMEKYPKFLTWFVLTSIKIVEIYRLYKLRLLQ